MREISAAVSIEALATATYACARDLGFRHLAYHLVKIVGCGDNLPTRFSNYPKDWISRYQACGYARIDPVPRAARSGILPFTWDDLASGADEVERAFLQDAARHGLADGLTVPIHCAKGFAILSMHPEGSGLERADRLSLAAQAATSLALHVHQRARALMEQRVLIERSIDAGLTRRERDCVGWLCAGHSAAEVADILGISVPTVTQHLRRAASRLDVANRTQLCMRAIALGLVEPG
ncbi:MAG: autoinducer binding domain-containing protein [Alphaproteobacteria bacterium]|nr:autoinducer binding domain-containing protein [Alphaproteobacteria bacterium]